jgi:hypothetical protein
LIKKRYRRTNQARRLKGEIRNPALLDIRLDKLDFKLTKLSLVEDYNNKMKTEQKNKKTKTRVTR